MLEEMDEEFGVGDLVAEEMKTERRNVYGTKDLRGLRVEHDLVRFLVFLQIQISSDFSVVNSDPVYYNKFL